MPKPGPQKASPALFQRHGGCPRIRNQAGWAVAALTAAVRGPKYVSKTLVKLNMGAYCNRISMQYVSPNAWISRDPEVVKAYDTDTLCTFPFTAATYREMLATLCHVSSRKWAQNIRKDSAGAADCRNGGPCW